MNTYVQDSQVATELARQDVLQYPHLDDNRTDYFGDFAFAMDDTGKLRQAPSELLIESMHHIGHEPLSVLDIGGGNGRQSLLLAELGHQVTMLDTDDRLLEFAREHARTRGIPTGNFKPIKQDMRELTSDDKYDVVMCLMTLHFLDRGEAHRVMRVMKAATVAGGLLMAEAYTTDNPPEEHQREIRHMFDPGELRRSIVETGGHWRLLRYEEGVYPYSVFRGHIAGQGMVLLPTVAQVIARNSVVSQRTFMNANRQIVQI